MADLNRTSVSQYYGVDSTLVSDDSIKSTQKAGIGVGAKLKALNTADPENSVTAFVVDAFDIDWRGFKLADGTAVTSTGALVAAIGSISSTFDAWDDDFTVPAPDPDPEP